MKKQIDTWINIINTLLVLVTFLIPDMEIKYRLIVLAIIVISFIFNFLKKYIRKFWKVISIILLLLISFSLISFIDKSLMLPTLVIVLTSLGITLILVSTIDKTEDLVIFSDSSFRDWKLNHWGTNYCSVKGDGMHFFGKDSKDEDGAHIDLIGKLLVSKKYIVECYAKSLPNTNGQLKLWCHDKPDKTVNTGESAESSPIIPKENGQLIQMEFAAKNNKNIRIHLQYYAGDGRIVVEWLRLKEKK